MSRMLGRRCSCRLNALGCAGAIFAGLFASGGATAQAVGDFNGDGFDDLAVGVPNEDLGDITSAGVVHVIFGAGAGLKAQNSQYWHNDKPHIPGSANEGDGFGEALAVGDFDNDGFDDLAIGIPRKKVGRDDGAGAVLVLRGKGGGLSTHGSSFWTQDEPGILDGAAEDEEFGFALTTGDFNGDGFDDLAIGVPLEGGPGLEGAVNIIYGSEDGLTSQGNQFFKRGSGETLAAGDFDNDGFDDLVIGSPREEVNGESTAGVVRVLFGSVDGVTNEDRQTWSQDTDGMAGIAEEGDQFGSALAVGDFNGDGFDDLAIGVARESIEGIINCGMVQVLHGSLMGLRAFGAQAWTQDSPGVLDKRENTDHFGWALVAADFNGDGFDDLAIGVPGEKVSREPIAGAVAVLYGSDEKLTADDDENWHQDVPNVQGRSREQDRFGFTLAAGDFDGDGRDDLAVGIPFEEVSGVAGAGSMAVFYGVNGGLSATNNQLWHQNRPGIADECEPGDGFGSAN